MIEGAGDRGRIAELCEAHGVSESQLHDWQVVARARARDAIDQPVPVAAR